jgi:hypothetical protein
VLHFSYKAPRGSRKRGKKMSMNLKYIMTGIVICEECGRKFDLKNEADIEAWSPGHGCED